MEVAALALCIAPALLQAQERTDTTRLRRVVVTATRSPVAANRAPASVSVVSGEQLRTEGITTVLDALRRVPGVSVVQTGSYGGQTSLFIRGGESRFAKVLVDGVPVNDAGGAFDFASLSTDNIDRIEIVRGPASVLYGSDAMAGVVQLFTKRGRGKATVSLAARGGGFGSFDADAAVRGGGALLDYSVAAARHSTDGIQLFNSAFRQTVASSSIGLRRSLADARLSMRYSDNTNHYPTSGAGEVVDSNALRKDGRLVLGIDAGYRVTSIAEIRLSLASHDVHGVSHDEPDSPGDKSGYYFSTGDRTRRRSGDLRMSLDLPQSVRLTLGGQVEREWQDSRTTSNFGPSAFTARRRTTGGYGQLLFAPTAPYTLTASGRIEQNEQFGDVFTWSAAGSAQVASSTRVRASLGTAFREPTFLENFGGAFVIGNPGLTPEHAVSLDASVEHDVTSALSLGATVFDNSFRDLIDYLYSETQPNYFNIARTRSRGVEIEGRVASPNGLQADIAATYLDTRVVDRGTSVAATAAFAPGARLLRRPMHTIDIGAGYRASRGGIDLRAHRVGPREDVYYAADFSSRRVTLAPYTRTDVSGDFRLMSAVDRTVTLTFRAENVFDVRYTDVAGFNYDFARTDDLSLARTGYRGAGRRLMAGLRASF